MENPQSPLKAIREKCIDCCAGQVGEVRLCTVEKCPLWPFRFGKNPFSGRREMTDEEKEAASERLKKAREAKKTMKEKM